MSSWERPLRINVDNRIYRCAMPLDIQLKRKTARGLTFFEVEFVGHVGPDEWDNCRLFPRGTLPCVWRAGIPLPPWHPHFKTLYQNSITTQLGRMDTSTQRLEGELDFGNRTSTVFFFMVHKAVRDPVTRKYSDLLIIKTANNLPWNAPVAVAVAVPEPEPSPLVDGGPGEDEGNEEGEDDLFGDGGEPIEDGTAHGNPK